MSPLARLRACNSLPGVAVFWAVQLMSRTVDMKEITAIPQFGNTSSYWLFGRCDSLLAGDTNDSSRRSQSGACDQGACRHQARATDLLCSVLQVPAQIRGKRLPAQGRLSARSFPPHRPGA